jgi:hypothetical protein
MRITGIQVVSGSGKSEEAFFEEVQEALSLNNVIEVKIIENSGVFRRAILFIGEQEQEVVTIAPKKSRKKKEAEGRYDDEDEVVEDEEY